MLDDILFYIFWNWRYCTFVVCARFLPEFPHFQMRLIITLKIFLYLSSNSFTLSCYLNLDFFSFILNSSFNEFAVSFRIQTTKIVYIAWSFACAICLCDFYILCVYVFFLFLFLLVKSCWFSFPRFLSLICQFYHLNFAYNVSK